MARGRLICALLGALLLIALLSPLRASAGGLHPPPEAMHALDLIYSGDSNQAMTEIRRFQTGDPDSPVGYLLEAEARWWELYCEACQIKWNLIDAWHRGRLPSDQAYLSLLDKAITLSDEHIAKKDTADMEFYAGLAWGLEARLYGLLDDHRGVARAGVNGRARMLRCLKLDPEMVDAYAGLGLYDYYVDALSALAKILRVFMGIPGGNKEEGIRQMRIAMDRGTVTRVGARFYLANNLRIYDHDYFQSIDVLSPLVEQYPQNPIYQLVLGDNEAKLARWSLAASIIRKTETLPIQNPACAARVREVGARFLATFPVREISVVN